MNMFTQNEIILMIGVVSTLLICITILTILDIRDYLKSKNSLTDEDFGEEYHEEKEEITPVSVLEVDEKEEYKPEEILVSDMKSDDLLLEEMEDEKFDIKDSVIVEDKDTVINVKEEPKKEKKRLEIFEDIDEVNVNLPNEKDDVTNFEMEQERTAIISLDELMQKSDTLYNDNEFVQYDDGNEPISIDEVIKMFNRDVDSKVEEKKVPEVMQDIVEEKREPYSKKETVPFISSVYGIEKQDNALEFENTASYEKLDRAKYNEFMAKLREISENK